MDRVFAFVSVLIVFVSISYSAPAIEEIDRIRIAEAYRIADKLQDRLWDNWSTATFGMLFITDDHEFLIRHPRPTNDFTSIGYDKLLKTEVFVRPRKFQKNFLATFPAFDSTPVIVIGKAENTTDRSSTRWVFVVLHEHFHQLQYSRPSYFADVNGLDLHGGDTTGMWQINYPLPYSDKTIAADFRKLTDLLSTAYRTRTDDALTQYLTERRKFAASLKPNDYKYASFQLWQEGIARYTQYKMARLAAKEMKPSKEFRALPDFVPFGQEADRIHERTMDEMRILDLAKWERVVFYPFGAVEGLILDRLNPKWRSKYFEQKFELERFYPMITAQ